MMTEPDHTVEIADLVGQTLSSAEPGQRQASEMASLYEMTMALNSATDLDERLRMVLQQVRRVLDYDICIINLATADGTALRVRAADGEGADRLLGIELPVDHGINAWIYREGKTVLVGDADTDPRRLHIPGRTESVRAAVGAPLIAHGHLIGTIYAGCRQPHTYTEAHLSFLSIAATQVAAAVQQARLLDQARRRAEEMKILFNIVVDMQRADDLSAKLQIIADGLKKLGWGRVSVSLRDADLNMIDLACSGFTPEDEATLRASSLPGSEWKKRFAAEFDRFRIGNCYYLPWSDAWVRENVRGVRSHMHEPALSLTEGAVTDGWHPQDLLYLPLYGREKRVVGIIGLDDPQDGGKPTPDSLHIIELFAQEAALAIENAKLLADLKLVNTDLQEMVTAQAHLLHTIEEMIATVTLAGSAESKLGKGAEIVHPTGRGPARA
jgi:GAF domain-containing protein